MEGDKLMNVMGKLDKKNKTNTFAIKETFCNTFTNDTGHRYAIYGGKTLDY